MIASLQPLARHLDMLESIGRKIKNFRNALVNQELCNHETREFCTTRDDFYRKLNEKYVLLNRAKVFSELIFKLI